MPSNFTQASHALIQFDETLKMAHTTLASTDRALEKIGEFVALQDYPSLKAVGRTFVQKAGVMVGLRRSIPKYNKKGKRRLEALELH